MKIGFIGLGNMGAPMAINLVNGAHRVSGFDIKAPTPPEIISCSSLVEAVKGSDIIFTMLPDGAVLEQVAQEILPAMNKQQILVDCSTVEYSAALEVSKLANNQNVEFLDAPVSGGITGATNGTLTFMVGGSERGFQMVTPLFEIMGSKIIHCGEVGLGQIAKVCNNMILGTTMIATCEAYGLGKRMGINLDILFEVISKSSGYSWSNNAYCPVPGIGPTSPADNDYEPGFSIQLMLKDLKLAQKAADSAEIDAVLSRTATEYYQLLADSGLSQKDFSAVMLRFLSTLS